VSTSITRHKGHCVAVRTSRVKHDAWNAWPHRAARAYFPGVYASRHIQHSSVGSGHADVTLRRRDISSARRCACVWCCCLFATLKISIAQKNTVLAVPWSILTFFFIFYFFFPFFLFFFFSFFLFFFFSFFLFFSGSFFSVSLCSPFFFIFLPFFFSFSFFFSGAWARPAAQSATRSHQLSFAATSVAILGSAPNSNNGCICASTVGPNWMNRENRS
jgi:hypothetical protein